jgi:O-acetyl-ADP-ribose deacetylase (regulator of RNase III)
MSMQLVVNKTRLVLIQGDITQQATDAIVNAANSGLLGGGGVDGAIHRAGGPVIMEECRRIREKIGRLPAGRAVITTGGRLKAKYVIHTVGPIWRGGGSDEAETLVSAYRESLKLAVEKGLRTISLPAISTGAYGYPLERATRVALTTAMDFARGDDSLQEIRFVLYDSYSYKVYADTLRELTPKPEG